MKHRLAASERAEGGRWEARLRLIYRSECAIWEWWWRAGLVDAPHWTGAWAEASKLLKPVGIRRSKINPYSRPAGVDCLRCGERFGLSRSKTTIECQENGDGTVRQTPVVKCPRCGQEIEL